MMEILDSKEKTIPLYYIWGIILFLMANLVYLMDLYPDVLENGAILKEGKWMIYSGTAGQSNMDFGIPIPPIIKVE